MYTAHGFKRSEVIREFKKCLSNSSIDEACYLAAELATTARSSLVAAALDEFSAHRMSSDRLHPTVCLADCLRRMGTCTVREDAIELVLLVLLHPRVPPKSIIPKDIPKSIIPKDIPKSIIPKDRDIETCVRDQDIDGIDEAVRRTIKSHVSVPATNRDWVDPLDGKELPVDPPVCWLWSLINTWSASKSIQVREHVSALSILFRASYTASSRMARVPLIVCALASLSDDFDIDETRDPRIQRVIDRMKVSIHIVFDEIAATKVEKKKKDYLHFYTYTTKK